MITQQTNIKYIDWLTQWLENYIRPSVKMRTYERYKLIVEQHIKDKIGSMELNELSPLVLQRFITELLQSGNKKTGKGLSANSVNAVISVIQSSLRTAHLLGLTKEYTADKLKRPKLQEKSVECFTIAEQKQIEKAVMNGKKDKLYGILLCLYSGLRIGELIALQWSDIDLTKGILTVSKSCHDSKDGLIIDAPKTISSRRMIPLPKQLLPIMKAYYRTNYEMIFEQFSKTNTRNYLTLDSVNQSLLIAISAKMEGNARRLIELQDRVKIVCTTVHKSKGLEYDSVYLPFTDDKIGEFKKNGIEVVWNGKELGYQVQLQSREEIQNEYFNSENELQEQIGEEARILYVALTRAINKIVWFEKESGCNMSWGTYLGGMPICQ